MSVKLRDYPHINRNDERFKALLDSSFENIRLGLLIDEDNPKTLGNKLSKMRNKIKKYEAE